MAADDWKVVRTDPWKVVSQEIDPWEVVKDTASPIEQPKPFTIQAPGPLSPGRLTESFKSLKPLLFQEVSEQDRFAIAETFGIPLENVPTSRPGHTLSMLETIAYMLPGIAKAPGMANVLRAQEAKPTVGQRISESLPSIAKTPEELIPQAVTKPSSIQQIARQETGKFPLPPQAQAVLQEAKENIQRIPKIVQRIEDKGIKPSDVTKPQGLYTSRTDVESPFKDLGGEITRYRTNFKNSLDVSGEMLVSIPGRLGPFGGSVPASSGIKALHKLVGESEFNRLSVLTREQAITEFSKSYPNVKWSQYHDVYEMLEGVAGIKARKAGYDSIIDIDAVNPAFSEYVGLTKTSLLRQQTAKRLEPMLTEAQAKAIESTQGQRLPVELKGERLTVQSTEKAINAAEDAMNRLGIQRDPNIHITEQVAITLERNPEFMGPLKESLQAAGANVSDFGRMLMSTSSTSARIMNRFSQLSKRMQTSPELQELAEVMAKEQPPMSGWELAGHFWSRFIDIWRGSLVSALSTAVRNLEVQIARVPLDRLERVIDGSIRGIFRLEGPHPPIPRATLRLLEGINKKGVNQKLNQILKEFPDETSDLFYRYSSDVARAARQETLAARNVGPIAKAIDRQFVKAEKAVDLFNIFNRSQEFFVRKTVFNVKMAERLAKKGINIDDIPLNQLDPSDIALSVDDALQFTFAADPKSGFWKHYLNLYNNPIGKTLLTPIAPFPRFMYNSWKFTFEHSPAGLLKLLSRKERQLIANGDPRTISKAIIGSGLFYAAWEVRNSEYAGEKWYHIKVGDKRFDVRPFAPLSSYFFIADLAKASQKGGISQLEAQDLAQGLFSGNFRAGAGLYALDQVNDLVAGLISGQDVESAARHIKRFGGELVAGFLQPLTTFRELYADYGQYVDALKTSAGEEAKIRERGEEPFLGPIKAKIPIVSQSLPELELATEGKTPRIETTTIFGVPISRQLSGIAKQRIANSTATLRRLGFTDNQVRGPSTGIPEADRLIKQQMGPIVERFLLSEISTDAFNKMSFAMKRKLVKEQFTEFRKIAKEQVFSGRPDLLLKVTAKGLDDETEQILKDAGVDLKKLSELVK